MRTILNKLVWFGGLLFFIMLVVRAKELFLRQPDVLSGRFISLILGGIVLYCVSICLIALSWTHCLNNSSSRSYLGYFKALPIYFISSIGKYAPGNVGHLVGRVALLERVHVPIKHGALSVLLETLLASVVAVVLSLSGLMMGIVTVRYEQLGLNTQLAIIVVLFSMLLFAIFGFRKKHQEKLRLILHTTRLSLLISLGYMFLAFLVLSTLSGIIALWWIPDGYFAFIKFCAVFPVAWLAGVLTPGAPAGIGTREFVMIQLLSPDYGTDLVTAVSVTMRTVTMLGDCLIFVVGTCVHSRKTE